MDKERKEPTREEETAPEEGKDEEQQTSHDVETTSTLTVEDLQEEVEALQERVVELEEEAAKNLDGWQRAQASFQNYRRRTEAEKEAWRISANAALLTRLLPILDDFERAFDNVPDSLEDHRWLDGVRLVKQKLIHLLDTESVAPISVEVGDEFDPQYHEAVLTQPVEGFEEGQIVAVAQRGYVQGDRVLRPTRVVVAAPHPEVEVEAKDVKEASEKEGSEEKSDLDGHVENEDTEKADE